VSRQVLLEAEPAHAGQAQRAPGLTAPRERSAGRQGTPRPGAHGPSRGAALRRVRPWEKQQREARGQGVPIRGVPPPCGGADWRAGTGSRGTSAPPSLAALPARPDGAVRAAVRSTWRRSLIHKKERATRPIGRQISGAG